MISQFDIAGVAIGTGRTFVIAEVGSNHGGDLIAAKEHIDAAAETGADAVKFQSINIHRLWHNPSLKISELHKCIDFPEEWHTELKHYAESRGLIFSSAPTYLEAVELMNRLDVAFFKIASAQIGTFPQLIRAVAASGKPTFFSTGIAEYTTIDAAVNAFRTASNEKFGIFHCNSLYPTPAEQVNLGRMVTYRNMFQCPVGFSDHTEGTAVVLGAVALGADMIEKHFRLEKTVATPDAPFSIPPADFSAMLTSIRTIEAARGDVPRLELEPAESSFREAIRYRLCLRHDKSSGDVLRPADFDYLRSAHGIDVGQEDLICERFVLSKTIAAGALLNWGDLEVIK